MPKPDIKHIKPPLSTEAPDLLRQMHHSEEGSAEGRLAIILGLLGIIAVILASGITDRSVDEETLRSIQRDLEENKQALESAVISPELSQIEFVREVYKDFLAHQYAKIVLQQNLPQGSSIDSLHKIYYGYIIGQEDLKYPHFTKALSDLNLDHHQRRNIRTAVRVIRDRVEDEAKYLTLFPSVPRIDQTISGADISILIGERSEAEFHLPISWIDNEGEEITKYIPLEHQVSAQDSQTYMVLARTQDGKLLPFTVFSYTTPEGEIGYLTLKPEGEPNDWVDSSFKFVEAREGWLRNLIDKIIGDDNLSLVRVISQKEAESLSNKLVAPGLTDPLDFKETVTSFDTDLSREGFTNEMVIEWIRRRNPKKYGRETDHTSIEDNFSKTIEVLLPQDLRELGVSTSVEQFLVTAKDGNVSRLDDILEVQYISPYITVYNGDRLPVFESVEQFKLDYIISGEEIYRILSIQKDRAEGSDSTGGPNRFIVNTISVNSIIEVYDDKFYKDFYEYFKEYLMLNPGLSHKYPGLYEVMEPS